MGKNTCLDPSTQTLKNTMKIVSILSADWLFRTYVSVELFANLLTYLPPPRV